METALVRVCNDLLINSGAGSLTVLMLLEIAAAFSPVNHGVLLGCLMSCAGLSAQFLSWLAPGFRLFPSHTSSHAEIVCVNSAGVCSSSTSVH